MTAGARLRRALVCATATAGALLGGVAAAEARTGLDFAACGEAADVQCATATLPLDYDRPNGDKVKIAIARVAAADPGTRVGTLFYNFGGPGAAAVPALQRLGRDLFPALSGRFDVVAIDPRGTGASEPSIDCQVNQEFEGIYSKPCTTPFNLDVDALIAKQTRYVNNCLRNGEILSHVSTANVARDYDAIRRLLGERKVSFLGFSYGTVVGATYGALYPNRYRAMVLDGPVDATNYLNKPLQNLAEQTGGFELAFGRFLQACARDQAACSGFGGEDPWAAFDELVERADANPIPADGYPADPRPVNGEDMITAVFYDIYAKQFWGELALALAQAEQGDGSLIRALVNGFYGNLEDGTFDPGLDRYFTIGASEQRYPRRVQTFLDKGDECWGTFEHFWSNCGYVELHYGLWPRRDRDAYYGPFTLPRRNLPALVVNTTYDPATPYRGGLRLARDLGNAVTLRMRGDGHTAYSGNSPCIDAAVEAYLLEETVPADFTTCRQEVPFAAPEPMSARSAVGGSAAEQAFALRVRGR